MPTLAELQEEADAIRSESRIWDDPELCTELRNASRHVGRILGHYERSISTLHQINGASDESRLATDFGVDVMEIADIPRFSDVAPYCPPGRAPRLAPAKSVAN